MDPYEPPKTPAPPPEPPAAKPGGRVPINLAAAILVINGFLSLHWGFYLAAFFFAFIGLLLARDKRHRVLGTVISCAAGGLCLFTRWLGEPF